MSARTRVRLQVAGYAVLVCAGLACAAMILTSAAGPAAGLLALFAVAIAAPFGGKVLWP